jgi:predicted ATPase
MPHLRSVALKMLAPAKRDKFPFNIPILKTLDALTFDAPITFFVGENGSGKSTLLEGIASAARLPTAGAHENDNDPTLIHARQLGSQLKLTWEKKPRNGFFLRSEDFFGYAKRLNTMRAEMEQELEDVDREFAGRSAHARGLARSAFSRELGALRASYGEGLDAQ